MKAPFLNIKEILRGDHAELKAAFARVLDSGRFVLGPELEAFEAEFAAYCGARHAVGVGTGLDALFLALKALGIGPGAEVIVPAHTFVATWLAIVRCGATPVAVEPDPTIYLITAQAVEARLTPRTRAVVAVHLYGSIAGIEELAALCDAKGLPLIEDAAQAHGAHLGGVLAGNFGTAGCFSFYPSKNLGALGDGGAVVTNDAALRDSVRALRSYGGRSRYQHDVEGTNSRLDELQAAFLRIRLAALARENERRQQIAQIYLTHLGHLPGLQLPRVETPGSHVWHLFVTQTERRDELQQHLLREGCETLIHYPRPVYRLPPFAEFAPRGSTITDRLASRVLSLPIGSHLSDADVHTVAGAISEFFTKSRAPNV